MAQTPSAFHTPNPKRDTILDAALHVVNAVGIKGASMEKIAARAGMSRPALYLHVSGKWDVLEKLMRRHHTLWLDELTQCLQPQASAADMLMGLCDGIITDPFWTLMHQQAPHMGETALAAQWLGARGEVAEHLANWLTQEAAAARVQCTAPERVAEAVVTALTHAASDGEAYSLMTLATLIGRGLRVDS